MIVLINGAFGVGKTTAAVLLAHRVPRSILYNPELVGSVLRATVGRIVRRNDYQDLPLWCPLVVFVAHVLHRVCRRDLIVPMCIWRRDYYDEITIGLRRTTPNIVCLRLTTSPSVLRMRILARPEMEGGHEWCLRHMDVCIAAFGDEHFGIEVSTDRKTPEAVVTELLAHLPR